MCLFRSVFEVHVSHHVSICIHVLLSGGFQGTLGFRQGPPAPSPALLSRWLSRPRALQIPLPVCCGCSLQCPVGLEQHSVEPTMQTASCSHFCL